jgi:hypothetical protein
MINVSRTSEKLSLESQEQLQLGLRDWEEERQRRTSLK